MLAGVNGTDTSRNNHCAMEDTRTPCPYRELAKGWVRIEEGDDARSHRVVLTESGLQRHALGQRQWRIAKAKVLQALGLHRVVRLYGLAEECRSVLALSQPASGRRCRRRARRA